MTAQLLWFLDEKLWNPICNAWYDDTAYSMAAVVCALLAITYFGLRRS